MLGYGNETEIKLSVLETVVAPVIEKILTDGSIKNLEDWEHKFICLFSTVQMIRTNDTREFLEGFNQILNKRITEWGYEPDTEVENYKIPSQAELKSSAIDLLNTLPSYFSGGFLNRELSLLKAPKGHNFYISDHPIVMHYRYA